MKKRRADYDIVRSIATVLVVCMHFIIGDQAFPLWPRNAVVNIGEMGVCLFFALSGATLCLSNPADRKLNVRRFFTRRVSSIFPMYYIAWLVFTWYGLLRAHTLNDAIPPKNLILTILGMDGYLLYRYPNFYRMGEWFLGCILLLYLLFPLLHTAIRKRPAVSACVILAVYGCTLVFYPFAMPQDRFVLMNLPIFCFGMYDQCYGALLKPGIRKVLRIACSIVLILSLFLGKWLGIPHNLLLIGVSGYISVMWAAQYLALCPPVSRLCAVISKYSFPVFLVHHIVAYRLESIFISESLSKLEYSLIFLLYLTLTAILARLLHEITGYIIRQIRMLFCKEAENCQRG